MLNSPSTTDNDLLALVIIIGSLITAVVWRVGLFYWRTRVKGDVTPLIRRERKKVERHYKQKYPYR